MSKEETSGVKEVKHSCSLCGMELKENEKGILCSACEQLVLKRLVKQRGIKVA